MSTYTPIATQILSANTASVIFSSIPQTYTDLVLVGNMRSSKTTATSDTLSVRFNNDSGSNYSNTNLYAISSAISNKRSNDAQWFSGEISSDSDTANVFTPIIYNIMNYTNPNTFKTTVNRTANRSLPYVAGSVCLYRSTSAITAITLYPAGGDFVAGSTFNLYGIQEGGGYALGGDIVTTDGTYWYHTFLSSGAFIPSQNLTNVDYLVIAGGGGAGYDGGGGAGGYRTSAGTSGGGGSAEAKLSLTANQVCQVMVGAGGSGGGQFGGQGSNSVFASITSLGGGAGVYGNPSAAGSPGGSGAGGTSVTGTTGIGGAGTANQGYAGGDSGYVVGQQGGGGGGAGAVGGTGSGTVGGNGGTGVASTITGSSVTRAGGGGGGSQTTAGSGGTGGGGKGEDATSNNAAAGTANTGGGGGGGYANFGKAGGSGIVIVRYAV